MTCVRATKRRSDGATEGSGGAASILALVLLARCQKALFPKDEPRTHFDLHDRTTGYGPPLELYDVFGNPQPALRERLTQPE